MPIPTRRLALVALGAALIILLGPDDWPGIATDLPVGPWHLPGPVVVVNLMLLVIAAVDAILAGKPSMIVVERAALCSGSARTTGCPWCLWLALFVILLDFFERIL